MTTSQKLDTSLARLGSRVRLEVAAGGLALGLGVALGATALGIAIARELDFMPASLVWLGSGIYLGTAIALALGLVWPLWRLDRRRVARALEARVPALDGRLETYVDVHRTDRSGAERGLFSLLAADALHVLGGAPARAKAPPGILARRMLAVGVAALGLLWLGFGAGGRWSYGAMRLWSLGAGVTGPSLQVLPGNASLAPGASLEVRVLPVGFAPEDVRIHARALASPAELAAPSPSGAAPDVAGSAGVDVGAIDAAPTEQSPPGPEEPEPTWDSARMVPQADGSFSFTFVGLRRPIAYYATANVLRTDVYEVEILAVPELEELRVRLVYPEWTHRAPQILDRPKVLEGPRGTRAEIEARFSATPGVVVLGGDEPAVRAEIDGAQARLSFVLEREARHVLETELAGKSVTLSAPLAVRITSDRAPELTIGRPGRDLKVNAIEEVPIEITVRDDFYVDEVFLHYARNGGAWTRSKLRGEGERVEASALVALEELGLEEPLRPGDVIAYYASARAHDDTVKSEMYLLEVRPFERRVLRGEAGQAGGGGSNPRDISQRQRQILVATWNLIRADETPQPDRIALIAELQSGLEDRTRTLIERVRARGGLGGASGPMAEFVRGLELAAGAMNSAAVELAAGRLESAIPSEQQALRAVLQAESAFRDVQIAEQQEGDGGGGGDEFLEVFDIEIDRARNRYEMASRADPAPEQRDARDEELARRLEELAERQRALAERMARSEEPTAPERWEQERLEREIRELREQIEQSQPGAAGGTQTARAREALDRAARALEEGSFESAERVARELRAAAEALSRAGRERDMESAADLRERARAARDRQAESARELERAVAQSELSILGERQIGFDQERALADEKAEIRQEVEALERDTETLARRLEGDFPEASGGLRAAAEGLERSGVDLQLSFAESLLRDGETSFVLAGEDAIEQALEDFRRALPTDEAFAELPARDAGDARREALRDLRAARARLREAESRALARPGFAPPPAWDSSEAGQGGSAANEPRVGALAPALRELERDLRALGIDRDTLRAISEASRSPGRGTAAQVRAAIAALDEIELALADRDTEGASAAPISAEAGEGGSRGASVDDYFRRLGRSAD